MLSFVSMTYPMLFQHVKAADESIMELPIAYTPVYLAPIAISIGVFGCLMCAPFLLHRRKQRIHI